MIKSKLTFEFEELYKFINDLEGEKDRSAAIISAAKLDLYLYHLLQRFLLPEPKSNDDLLDNEQYVGSFNARICLAMRLGLIDPDFARSLHIVRKIRNIFAHELTTSSLNDGPKRNLVRELVGIYSETKLFEKFLGHLATGKDIAVHLDAFNHCLTTRDILRDAVSKAGLSHKVMIPADGELMEL